MSGAEGVFPAIENLPSLFSDIAFFVASGAEIWYFSSKITALLRFSVSISGTIFR